ncbi:MAG: hypothetical protein ACTSRG_09715 [Candidatus Helarchaeota archaeon]
MKCEICGCDLSETEILEYDGKKICEDCYMDAQIDSSPGLKICDPSAVHLTKKLRETLGQTGTEGLSEIQKKIYEMIKSNKQVTIEELASKFKLKSQEVENNIAVLRHCELVKGRRIGNKVFIIPFED